MNAPDPLQQLVLAERGRFVAAGGLNEQGQVPSPCVAVCRMDEERRYCVGCWRTLDELRAWSTLDAEGKRLVWQDVMQRLESQP